MITQEKRKTIIELYRSGLSQLKVSKKTGVCPQSIRNILADSEIPVRAISTYSRKYTVNEQYFDKIDTREKAYFLGLLYADGCNYEKRSTVQIQLQKRDIAVLERLNLAIENKRSITIFSRRTAKGEVKDYAMLRINSPKLSKTLFALGCVYAKSQILKEPPIGAVPDELQNSFLLGYFDGDGSITFYAKKKAHQLMFVCNETFKPYVERLLQPIAKFRAIKRVKKSTSLPVYQVTISNYPDMRKVVNWMTCAETDALQIERKRERMQQIRNKAVAIQVRKTNSKALSATKNNRTPQISFPAGSRTPHLSATPSASSQ